MSTARDSAFTGRLWSAVRKPEGSTESTRWLFALMSLVALVVTLPVAVSAANGGALVVIFGAAAFLIASGARVFITGRIPFAQDLLDTLVIFVFALATPGPATLVAYVFEAVWFRAFYGTVARSLVRCALCVTAVSLTVVLWPTFHGGAAAVGTVMLVQSFPLLFLVVLIARQLLSGLLARDQTMLRDSALAVASSRLLDTIGATAIRDLAWTAMAEICAATPGVRVLKVVRHGAGLRVNGVAGRYRVVPVALPGAAIHGAGAAGIVDDKLLNDCVGLDLVWECIFLTEQAEDAWLVVGAPKKAHAGAVLSVRTLANQVSLALRNNSVHEQLILQAEHDSLTGLSNRAAFASTLSRHLADPDYRGLLHVLFLDLDDFKDVNDVLGHNAGDAVLVEVAVRLRRCTRPDDVCARLGGDEFAVMLHGGSGTTAAEIAQRIVDSILLPIMIGDVTCQVGASVGVATAAPTLALDELVHQADVAMYAAKAKGKSRVQVFDPDLLQA